MRVTCTVHFPEPTMKGELSGSAFVTMRSSVLKMFPNTLFRIGVRVITTSSSVSTSMKSSSQTFAMASNWLRQLP